MFNTRRFGFVATLGLVLVMILGAATPALGASTNKVVVVNASYAPRLVVDWSGAPFVAFGEARNWAFDVPAQMYRANDQSITVVVTSNLPYTSTLNAVDGPTASGGLALANGFSRLVCHRIDGGLFTSVVAGDNGFAGVAGSVGVAQPDVTWFGITIPLAFPSGTLHVIATITVTQIM
jgi:hypothetical protein